MRQKSPLDENYYARGKSNNISVLPLIFFPLSPLLHIFSLELDTYERPIWSYEWADYFVAAHNGI